MRNLALVWVLAGVVSVTAVQADVQLWKSGGTTATYSDGTLRVRPSLGVAVEYVVRGYCLTNIPKIRWRGAMKDYTIIAPQWRSVADSITNVVIEPGVTYIGNRAFANQFHVLKSITIPNTVTEIGWGVFEEGASLKSITIPESVTKIGAATFPGAHSGWGYLMWEGMDSIISLNPVPPEMGIQIVCVETVLYVPESSIDAYKAAAGWNKFWYIAPINGEYGYEPLEGERGLCYGIGWCDKEVEDCEEYYYFQGEFVRWIGHITRILMFYGIAYWLYLLLVFMLKKKYRVESKKAKVLSIIFTPILTFIIWFLWMLGGNYFWAPRTGPGETYYLPYYLYEGAITYGGIYLAVTAIFYQVFRKKIKRRATIVILATLHIIIFASLMINGGL